MHDRIAAGEPVGLLAYLGDEPVGWCSVAPRPTFRSLGGPEDHNDDPNAVWSLTCLFVKRAHRGEGIADALVSAAIDHAQSAAALILEAYPVDPDSPSYRFMGFAPQMEKHGFVKVGTAGKRRHVYRRALHDGGRRGS